MSDRDQVASKDFEIDKFTMRRPTGKSETES